jgi:hypothetical protein
MSFVYTFNGATNSDYVAMGINSSNLLALGANVAGNGTPTESGILDVSAWRGQTVNLGFALGGTNITPAQLTVQSIRFYGENQPPLFGGLSRSNLVLLWPTTLPEFQLQSTADSVAGFWSAVTNGVQVQGIVNVVQLPILQSRQFFRLRQNP